MAGRIWIFTFERELSPSESEVVSGEIRRFAGEWKAHGDEVEALAELRYGQFVLMQASEECVAASGCSIDGLFRTIKRLSDRIGVPLAENSSIVFRDGERIAVVTRDAFKDLARQGKVRGETVVFDQSIRTLDDFLAGKWEIAVKDSWHRSLL